MVDPRRQEPTEDEPQEQPVEGLSGEGQQAAVDPGALAACIRRRAALTAHETRLRIRRAQSTARRTVILHRDLGGLEPARIRRFARSVAGQARAMQPHSARRPTQSQAASWGSSLDMTLPGSGTGARSDELSAGSVIKPGTFTTGQVIPPLSGPPQRPPSIGTTPPGARSAAPGRPSQPAAGGPPPQGRPQKRQVPPKSRLFSRIEEVRPGGGSPSFEGPIEETGDEEGDSAAPLARQGIERTAGLDELAVPPHTPAPVRPRAERRGTQPPSPAAPARAEPEISAAHPSAGEMALPVRGVSPAHPAASTPHVQRAPQEAPPETTRPQPPAAPAGPDVAAVQKGPREDGAGTETEPLAPPRVDWFGQTTTQPANLPVRHPAAPRPADRLPGVQEGPGAPGAQAPDHPIIRRAPEEGPAVGDELLPAPRLGWFGPTAPQARRVSSTPRPSLPSTSDVGSVVQRPTARSARPARTEDTPANRQQAPMTPAAPPEVIERPDVRPAAAPEARVQGPAEPSARRMAQHAPETQPEQVPGRQPEHPVPQPQVHVEDVDRPTAAPAQDMPVQRMPEEQAGEMPVVQPVHVQRAPEEQAGETLAEHSPEKRSGEMPVIHPVHVQRAPEEQAGETPAVHLVRAPRMPEEQAGETPAVHLVRAPRMPEEQAGETPIVHPVRMQRMPEEQAGETPVARPERPVSQPEAQAKESSEPTAAPDAPSSSRALPVQLTPEEQAGETPAEHSPEKRSGEMPVVHPVHVQRMPEEQAGETPAEHSPEKRSGEMPVVHPVRAPRTPEAPSDEERAAGPAHPTPQTTQAGEPVVPAAPVALPPLRRERIQRTPDRPPEAAGDVPALDQTAPPAHAPQRAVSRPEPENESVASGPSLSPRLRWFDQGNLGLAQESGMDVARPGAPSIQRAPDGQHGLPAAPAGSVGQPAGRQDAGAGQGAAGETHLPAAHRPRPALRPARRGGRRPWTGATRDQPIAVDRIQTAPEVAGQAGARPEAAPGPANLPLAQIAAPDEGAAGATGQEMPLRDHILSRARARAQAAIHHSPASLQRGSERGRSWRQLWQARRRQGMASTSHVERRPLGGEAADLDLSLPAAQAPAVPEVPAGAAAGPQQPPAAGPVARQEGLGALERELPLRSAPQAAAGQEKETTDRSMATGAERIGSAGGTGPARPAVSHTTGQWDVVVQRDQEEPDTAQAELQSEEPDLARLAQQIYPLIKRMLAIERERRPYR